MAKLTQEELKRYIVDEVVRASSRLGVAFQELSCRDIEHLRQQLSSLFGRGPEYLLTFENMLNPQSLQAPDAWRRLSEFLTPHPHVLFYDSPGALDCSGVLFPNGTDIPDVLGECFGFPFYVTDEGRTFVVGMNEDDYLVGVGTAAPWVGTVARRP